MNKKTTLISALLFASAATQAQELNGFRTDNYNGVSGAFFNPANLSGSPYKVDVHLFGMNLFAGNNNLDFSFGTFSDIASDTNVLNSFIGNGRTSSLMTNVAFHLPSISYKVNEKLTVGFLTRARILFNVVDFDGTLVNSITSGANNPSLPYDLGGSSNMRMSINAFADYGLTGAYTVYNEGNHFVKVGATLKYLAGVGNTYLQLDKINGTIDTLGGDAVATKASGTIALGSGGLDLSDPSFSLNANANGFGADLGVVYEYRPKNLADEKMPYLFKVNAALLDIGGINYTVNPAMTAGYSINIPAGTYFNLSNLEGDDLKTSLDKYPGLFRTVGPTSSYKVALPRTMQIGADFRATKGVYVAANMQLGMTNTTSKAYNAQAVNAFTITPRFETKMFAAYLPINFSNLSKTSIGMGLRAGPLFVGSASLVSMLISSSRQMDFYFGCRFGIKDKSHSKKERNDA